jgi:hypothetical protein
VSPREKRNICAPALAFVAIAPYKYSGGMPFYVSLRQNGVGTDITMGDAILPKMFIRDGRHLE